MTTLDTHEIVENLQAAGMPKPQAEAVMRAIKTREDFAFAQLVTKTDLAGLGQQLSGEIQELSGDAKSTRQDLKDNYATKYDLSRMETRLVMWLVGTALALFGLMKAFPQISH